jgi:butyryl-CoA dehydrogenase
MNQFAFTPEQIALRDLARDVARDVYAPMAQTLEDNHSPLPEAEVRRLADLGFLSLALPEEYGGAGSGLMDALIVIEELAKECRPAAFQVFEANVGPARVVQFFGNEDQRRRILPPVAAGKLTMAIGISEPDAGSAATHLRTKATRSGNDYIISGTKRWISNGGHADHYLIYCRFDDIPGAAGVGAVIVRADAPGMSYGSPERLMGFRGIPSADILLDDVRVSAADVVLGPGSFGKLFGVFSIERLGNSTMSLAIGQAALDRTIAYVQAREQFGQPIINFQNVQVTVAEMAMQVDAARLLIQRAATNGGTGLPDPLEVSIAKCFANEMAKKVSDLAMQMHGGNGYTAEYGIERLHRDAHGWAIAGGTPAIQRIRIASQLVGRSLTRR